MTTRARTSPALWLATLSLVALATVAVELADAEPGQAPVPLIGWTAATLVLPSLAAAAWFARRPTRLGATSAAEVAVVALLMAIPFAARPVLAAWSGRGVPLEVVLLGSLRNLGLGLGALAVRPASARLAAAVALFLVLIAGALGEGPALLGAIGVAAVAGVCWLVIASWEGMGRPAAGGGDRPPVVAPAAWAGGFAALLIGAVAVGPTRTATVLAELVASSGGTGSNDPDARGGVNDGDDEVAASQDPRSVGFTDSEVFLESDRPSLYDSFTDQYGEPIKPKARRERMVAMKPGEQPQQEAPTENLRPGRRFPTARERPTRRAGRGADREAQALCYVKGTTPLHLGLATYDRFDGRDWEEEAHTDQHCPLELVPGGAWLRLDQPMGAAVGGDRAHQIKIGTLDSSTLPVPAHLCRFRVGSVNRPDFFAWAQAGLVRMVGRTVPAGTVIDTESLVADPRRLRSVAFETPRAPPAGRYVGLPEGLDPAVVALARSWADGVPRGWGQVEAIVAGVRGRCRHDRSAVVAADGGDVLGRFLLGSRAGPDYQFASAAAVALRLLAYPCRVVSGYYAAPGRYDPRTKHTPIRDEDVHFWVEVQLPGGAWAVVEPTPGYEVPVPARSWGDALVAGLRAAGRWSRAHWPLAALGLVGLATAIGRRHRLGDGVATLAWRLGGGGSSRGRALGALRLLEARSSRAGLRRPAGRTPARWYRAVGAVAPADARGGLDRLVAIAGWAAHAPDDPSRPPPWSDREIDAACRQAVRDWTLDRFRLLRRSSLAEVPSR